MSEFEFRSMAEPVEFRSAGANKIVATGVALRYGVASQPFPRQGKTIREEFRSGAFTKSLQERGVFANYEHRREALLGSTASGTMRITDTSGQMAYEVDLPDTPDGRTVAVLLERRDLQGSSVGFRSMPKDEKWSVSDDGFALRSVGTSVLDHIAMTCAPVHETSSAGLATALRSLSEQTGIEVRSLVEAACTDLPGLITTGHPEHRSSKVGPLLEQAAALLTQAAAAYGAEEAGEPSEDSLADIEDHRSDDGSESTVAIPLQSWLYA